MSLCTRRFKLLRCGWPVDSICNLMRKEAVQHEMIRDFAQEAKTSLEQLWTAPAPFVRRGLEFWSAEL